MASRLLLIVRVSSERARRAVHQKLLLSEKQDPPALPGVVHCSGA
jgi:hypothetical protein